MTTTNPYDQSECPFHSDLEIAFSTILRCRMGLERQLAGLSTANKNRVLLALHAQISEQLDALSTDNSQ